MITRYEISLTGPYLRSNTGPYLTYANEGGSNEEGEYVAPPGLIVTPVAFSKPSNVGEQLVFTHSLERR